MVKHLKEYSEFTQVTQENTSPKQQRLEDIFKETFPQNNMAREITETLAELIALYDQLVPVVENGHLCQLLELLELQDIIHFTAIQDLYNNVHDHL